MSSIVILVLNIAYLCWNIITSNVSIAHSDWLYTVCAILDTFNLYYLFVSVIEFVCAQSPYSSRALLFGYTITIITFSGYIGLCINSGIAALCSDNCQVIRDSLSVALAVEGRLWGVGRGDRDTNTRSNRGSEQGGTQTLKNVTCKKSDPSPSP